MQSYYKLAEQRPFEIRRTYNESEYIAYPLVCLPMSDREIIYYLEEKTRLLEKTIETIKIYSDDDYFKASFELEEFLKNFKVYGEK
jgi:hypothetical protein